MSTATGQLAWAEARRLLRNPLPWLSLIVLVPWFRSAQRIGGVQDRLFLLVGYGLLLPGFVLVVVTVLAVLRGRMERTEELLGSLSVGADRRAVGHALAASTGGLIGLLVAVGVFVWLPARDPLGPWSPWYHEIVDIPRPNLAQLLQGPLAVTAVLVFAVALVRWVPSWLVLVPLAFLLLVQGLWFGMWHGTAASGQRWLFPLNTGIVNGSWVGCATEIDSCELPVSGFDRSTPWWHAAYLIALCLWLTSAAVLRDRRDRTTWTWFGVSLVAVAALAAVQFSSANTYTATPLPGP